MAPAITILIMDVQTRPTIRVKIKEILRAKGWTQKEMAAATNISMTTISNLHTTKMVRFETLVKLVEATGWPLEMLLEYKE